MVGVRWAWRGAPSGSLAMTGLSCYAGKKVRRKGGRAVVLGKIGG